MSADRPEEGGSTKQARMWTRFVFLWQSRARLDDGMALNEPLGDLWQHLLIGCGETGEFTVLSAGWNQMRVGVNLPGFSNRQIAATPLNDCTLGVPIELVRAGHLDVTDFTLMEAGELGDPKSPCRRAPQSAGAVAECPKTLSPRSRGQRCCRAGAAARTPPALTRDFTGFPFLIGISAVVPSGISAKSRRRPPMPAT